MPLENSEEVNIAGVDEAGRGALAGPVVAAAVIFSSDQDKTPYKDSKQLTPQQRERLYDHIIHNALSVGIGLVHHDVIDRVNILQATYKAMHKAIGKLSVSPDMVLVDGHLSIPDLEYKQKPVIKGDQRVPVISAASIIAKVARDRIMIGYDKVFKNYEFKSHKGYGTKRHLECIDLFGYCRIHRRSYNISKQMSLF